MGVGKMAPDLKISDLTKDLAKVGGLDKEVGEMDVEELMKTAGKTEKKEEGLDLGKMEGMVKNMVAGDLPEIPTGKAIEAVPAGIIEEAEKAANKKGKKKGLGPKAIKKLEEDEI